MDYINILTFLSPVKETKYIFAKLAILKRILLAFYMMINKYEFGRKKL